MSVTQYIKETKSELKRVSWPSRKQIVMFTAIVMALSIVVSLFLGLFDYIFSSGLSQLIGPSNLPSQDFTVEQEVIDPNETNVVDTAPVAVPEIKTEPDIKFDTLPVN